MKKYFLAVLLILSGCVRVHHTVDAPDAYVVQDESETLPDYPHQEEILLNNKQGYSARFVLGTDVVAPDESLSGILNVMQATETVYNARMNASVSLKRITVIVPTTDEEFAWWCGIDVESVANEDGCSQYRHFSGFASDGSWIIISRRDIFEAGRNYLYGLVVHELLHAALFDHIGDVDLYHTNHQVWNYYACDTIFMEVFVSLRDPEDYRNWWPTLPCE